MVKVYKEIQGAEKADWTSQTLGTQLSTLGPAFVRGNLLFDNRETSPAQVIGETG